MTQQQVDVKRKIECVATMFGIDPAWAVAVAMVESSLGLHQISPTGCVGVFQMSTIAMKDLLQEMVKDNDELVDIVCGVAFLRLLLHRWHSMESATDHFCDPGDRGLYLDRVKEWMTKFRPVDTA